MLHKTRASTAKCNEEIYSLYLLSDPYNTSCTRLSEIMKTISHDSVNRFLERERYEPKDLFDAEKDKIDRVGGTLSVDDSVLDKPYSDPSKADLIDHFWSGKHHRVVKGIHLITLFYTDIQGISVPVNYRIYDKRVGKTKNDFFKEMLLDVLSWGLIPAWVTGDSWYSSLPNLKLLRKQGLNFMFGVESNRRISIDRGQYIQIQTLEDWDENGKIVYLKDYGRVKVYRQVYKNAYRYYIVSTAELDHLETVTRIDFERMHSSHWSIERYHRALKQVCNIEKFQVRKEHSIKNHIFCAIKSFVKLEVMRSEQKITNWYEIRKNLFMAVIRKFISQKTFLQAILNA